MRWKTYEYANLNMLVILCRKGVREVITGSQKRDEHTAFIQHGILPQQGTDLSLGTLRTFLWEGQCK